MNKPRPLAKDEIECKVKQITEKGCLILLYKTARTDMQILDETFGAENWQCSYQVVNENLYCSISVYDESKKEWVSKSDCGVESNQDAEKGEASDAFKRAGFRWGIGRELYTTPFVWLSVPTKKNSDGKWVLEGFFSFEVKSIEIKETDCGKEITQLTVIAKDRGSEIAVFNFPKTAYVIGAVAPKEAGSDKLKEQMAQLNAGQTLAVVEWCVKKYGKRPEELTDVKQQADLITKIVSAKYKADQKISDDNMPF